MKKIFKFIFKFIFIIAIIVLLFSFCSYKLVSKASNKKLEEMGTQMFGSPFYLQKELTDGNLYAIIIENPLTFTAGNMLLVQNIKNNQDNENNSNVIISGLTINYAINKDDNINLHVIRDNAKKYIQQNLEAINQLNNLLIDKNSPNNSVQKESIVKSILFINPTLLLFIDDEYKGIATIPSFSLQYSNSEKTNLATVAFDSISGLTAQSDKAVLNLLKK